MTPSFAPSPEELQKVQDWLEDKGFACPACRKDDFALGGTHFVPNASAATLSGESQYSLYLAIRCNHCAFVSWLDPVTIGLDFEAE